MRVWEDTTNHLSDEFCLKANPVLNADVHTAIMRSKDAQLNSVESPIAPPASIPISIPDMRCVTNENKSRTIEAGKHVHGEILSTCACFTIP